MPGCSRYPAVGVRESSGYRFSDRSLRRRQRHYPVVVLHYSRRGYRICDFARTVSVVIVWPRPAGSCPRLPPPPCRSPTVAPDMSVHPDSPSDEIAHCQVVTLVMLPSGSVSLAVTLSPTAIAGPHCDSVTLPSSSARTAAVVLALALFPRPRGPCSRPSPAGSSPCPPHRGCSYPSSSRGWASTPSTRSPTSPTPSLRLVGSPSGSVSVGRDPGPDGAPCGRQLHLSLFVNVVHVYRHVQARPVPFRSAP